MKSLFTVCLLTTLLSGCATLDEKKKEQYFNDTVRVYEQAIRWADFATATSFQRLEQTATPQAMPPDSIRVTSYQQLNAQVLADGEEVRVSVKIDYYNSDTLKVVTLMDNQVWKFDPDETAWYITTPLPAFR
jgi:hypothetical protein